MNQILGTAFATDEALTEYMTENKTDVALRLFETTVELDFPEYISNAVA